MAEISLKIDVEGLEGALNELRRVRDALEPPSLTESVGDGADVFVLGARARAPHLSGELAASIDKQLDGGTTWTIAPSTIYAGVQEFGATIDAQDARALAFVDDGILHFASVVHIPPSPYMTPTFLEDQAAATEAVEMSIRRKIG